MGTHHSKGMAYFIRFYDLVMEGLCHELDLVMMIFCPPVIIIVTAMCDCKRVIDIKQKGGQHYLMCIAYIIPSGRYGRIVNSFIRPCLGPAVVF